MNRCVQFAKSIVHPYYRSSKSPFAQTCTRVSARTIDTAIKCTCTHIDHINGLPLRTDA